MSHILDNLFKKFNTIASPSGLTPPSEIPIPRLTILAFFVLVSITSNAQKTRFSFSEQKMGSPLHIIFYAQDSVSANKQARACFELIDSLNHIFSNYDSSSELSSINNNAGIAKNIVSSLMWELIMQSKEAYIKSKGAYNIAMGPLTQLWRTARRLKQFPSQVQIKNKLLLCDFNKIQLNNDSSCSNTIHIISSRYSS